ncbi:MAG: PadR family transcriptional regulator [Bryobacteraceae bacterium]|nr:PadR family transcriptional regulator [Bryobacteraceae bacterium]
MKGKAPTTRGRKARSTGQLTTADLIVLSLLAERSMHGYELLGEYERQEVADWASVSKAQVYYAIQKLSTLKLIESQEDQPGDGARDRTVYAPTSEGLKKLSASLTSMDWARTRVAQPFTTWLGLSIHLSPAAVARVMKARQVFLEEELARERASLCFIKSLSSARARAGEGIVDLVIRQIEVELEWIRNFLKAR